jgi:hypothetical protein
VLTFEVILSIYFTALSIFWLHRQRVGSDRNTNGVIDRLIRTALQTGIAPLLFALAGLIAFSKIECFSLSLSDTHHSLPVALPNTNLFITFVIPIGRTYSAVYISLISKYMKHEC